MARDQLNFLMRQLHEAARPDAEGGLPDAQLVELFRTRRDPLAFEVLVWRHGPMVLKVCRRVLRHDQDAEDAFQATFLTLVRKAGSISKRESIASWLYQVAYRIALRLRATVQRQRAREARGQDLETVARPNDSPSDDLGPVLDEEVSRLPRRYRVPFVLRYLAGLSNEETARQVGAPEGTVCSRLARARSQLRSRLIRRGVAPAALALILNGGEASAAVPAALARGTLGGVTQSAASGAISARVVALTEGMVKAMFLRKVKTTLAVLALVALGLGGLLAYSQWQPLAAEMQFVPQKLPDDDTKGWQLHATHLDKDAKKVDVAALSADGKLLAVVTPDRTVKVWDIAAGKVQGVYLKGHPGLVEAVAFSPDGNLLAAGCGHLVIVYDLKTGAIQRSAATPYPGTPHVGSELKNVVAALALSPDNTMLAACNRGESWVYLVDLNGKANDPPHAIFLNGVLSPRTIAYNAKSTMLAAGGPLNPGDADRGAVGMATVDLKAGKNQGDAVAGCKTGVHCVAFAPDGKMMAADSSDNSVVLYSTGTGNVIKALATHTKTVRTLAFSPDGKLLATAGDDRTILIRDPKVEKPLTTLVGHSFPVLDVRFVSDSDTLTSVDDHGIVKVWKMKKS